MKKVYKIVAFFIFTICFSILSNCYGGAIIAAELDEGVGNENAQVVARGVTCPYCGGNTYEYSTYSSWNKTGNCRSCSSWFGCVQQEYYAFKDTWRQCTNCEYNYYLGRATIYMWDHSVSH